MGELRSIPVDELRRVVSEGTVLRWDEPLDRRTTLRVGGKADAYVEPATEADLAAVVGWCAEQRVPYFVLGRGSNLLVRDGGIRGVVICLAQPLFAGVAVEAGERVCCGGGAKLKAVATEARRAGLSGLEFLEGIPGSVGGGLRMNAGAMGSWIFEVVESVRVMDERGEIDVLEGEAMGAEYRGCEVLRARIALRAILRGRVSARGEIEERTQAYNARRWKSQPATPSAGCVFKNPLTVPAGRLVEELGMKGMRVGGAVISEVHGNFIVNEGGAKASDVLRLIALVQERARAMRGIELETELEIVGEMG
jgi:UDP-N-acetylenolpyruvoylglucosamine reductase